VIAVPAIAPNGREHCNNDGAHETIAGGQMADMAGC